MLGGCPAAATAPPGRWVCPPLSQRWRQARQSRSLLPAGPPWPPGRALGRHHPRALSDGDPTLQALRRRPSAHPRASRCRSRRRHFPALTPGSLPRPRPRPLAPDPAHPTQGGVVAQTELVRPLPLSSDRLLTSLLSNSSLDLRMRRAPRPLPRPLHHAWSYPALVSDAGAPSAPACSPRRSLPSRPPPGPACGAGGKCPCQLEALEWTKGTT